MSAKVVSLRSRDPKLPEYELKVIEVDAGFKVLREMVQRWYDGPPSDDDVTAVEMFGREILALAGKFRQEPQGGAAA